MTYRHLLVSKRKGIVTVRLNRAAQRNALSFELMRELTQFAQLHRTRADVRAIVLAGSPEFFSAGFDLKEDVLDPAGSGRSLLELRELMAIGPNLCKAWEEIEAVTIMAIEGFCIGGACVLALCCDFRVMSESGWMRVPEVPLGMSMSWHFVPRLTMLVGAPRAKRFIMFGEKIDAKQLLEWGMIDEQVAVGEADAAALRWAQRIIALPPLPVRMTKEAVNAAASVYHHTSSFMDRDQFLLTLGSDELRDNLRSFTGRRSAHQGVRRRAQP